MAVARKKYISAAAVKTVLYGASRETIIKIIRSYYYHLK